MFLNNVYSGCYFYAVLSINSAIFFWGGGRDWGETKHCAWCYYLGGAHWGGGGTFSDQNSGGEALFLAPQLKTLDFIS